MLTIVDNIRCVVILMCALVTLHGCSGKVIYLKSQGSLNETSLYSPTKIYGLSELPLGLRDTQMRVTGVEIDANLNNSRTVRSYDTSFGVPIAEKTPDGTGTFEIGRRPFRVVLHIRTEEPGFIFSPATSMLYIRTSPEPLLPSKVLFGKRNDLKTYFNCDTGGIITGSVVLFSKQQEEAAKLPMSCIQLQFDLPTPDPSEKFHLKLGEIVTPSGELICPTIYFSPVNVVEIVH